MCGDWSQEVDDYQLSLIFDVVLSWCMAASSSKFALQLSLVKTMVVLRAVVGDTLLGDMLPIWWLEHTTLWRG